LRKRAGATQSSRATTAMAGGAALAIVVAFALAGGNAASYYDGGSAAFCLVVAALIAGVERRGPNPVRDLFSLPPARYAGRISYALYLWHWPVIVWATSERVPYSGFGLTVFRLALMTALAAASTHLLEEPIRRGRLGRSLTPRRLAYALPAVSVVMVLMTFGLTQGARSSPTASASSVAAAGSAIGATAPHNASHPNPSRARHLAAARSPSPRRKPVGIVFGDSVPELLKPSLEAAARRADVRLVDAAVPGCGVAAMTLTDESGNVVSWQSKCDTIAYPDERAAIARYRPDFVIWYSGTENAPMLVGGVSYPPGTPQHRRALRRLMIAAHDRLTVDGAHLYLVKLPPHADPPGGCASPDANLECAANATFNPTVPYVNAQFTWLAHRYRDTSLISLEGLICPGGSPCPATINGVPVRPDSTHFSETFAPRVANALLASALPGRR
jgi:hypothetical protein